MLGAGLNPTVRLALIVITAPVWGFLPLRALRDRTVKVPKPGIWNRLLFFIAFEILTKVASTASPAALLLRFAVLATESMSSLLVIVFCPSLQAEFSVAPETGRNNYGFVLKCQILYRRPKRS